MEGCLGTGNLSDKILELPLVCVCVEIMLKQGGTWVLEATICSLL